MEHSPIDSPHLGGHKFVSHIDINLLKYFNEFLGCKSMLDIGCGLGGMVYEAKKIGFTNVLGIDGDYRLKREDPNLFLLHDFTKGPCDLNQVFDLGYSCEFVEHVEEKYIKNFLDVFTKCKYIILTFAPPNTPGYHHVNCQPAEYWISKLTEYNFIYDETMTQDVRKLSSMKKNFVRNNGLCFKNKSFI